MGYLTTVTFYNDGADLIKKNQEELAEKLHMACTGFFNQDRETASTGLGHHANLITIQKPRHADDKTVFVHAGNTVVNIGKYSSELEWLYNRNPAFFDELLKEAERSVKHMKEIKKKLKKS